MKAEAKSPDNLAMFYGAIICRLWLAVRAIQTGIEKYAGTTAGQKTTEIAGQANEYGLTDATSTKTYSMLDYHGIPTALYDSYANQPLIPSWSLKLFDKTLGPVLLILGLTILLGIASRTSLFLLGLLYISLTWGLILLGEPGNSGSAWLAAHELIILASLYLMPYDKFRLLKKW